jgi:hypothetical protein
LPRPLLLAKSTIASNGIQEVLRGRPTATTAAAVTAGLQEVTDDLVELVTREIEPLRTTTAS